MAAVLRECVGAYANATNVLRGDSLKELVREVKATCLSLAEEQNSPNTWEEKTRLAGSRFALPIVLGIYGPGGRELELRYFCGDVCPDYGYVGVLIARTTAAECCTMGATPDYDGARNTYFGCVPAELSNERERQWGCALAERLEASEALR